MLTLVNLQAVDDRAKMYRYEKQAGQGLKMRNSSGVLSPTQSATFL